MGNAFVAGLKNEAPRGRDITNEDRNSEVSQRGDEGSEFSYNQMRFLAGKCSKMRLRQGLRPDRPPLGELTALPSAANLFTVDSRRVVSAR